MPATVKQILESIRWFSLEARNPRNDGWVQQAYRDHLLTIQQNVNEAIADVNEPRAAIPRVVTAGPNESKKWWDAKGETSIAHAVAAPDIITDRDE
jgi:hypothetical protein